MMSNETKSFQDTEYTKEDLVVMTGPELVSLYNLIASNILEANVKKFKDLDTGRQRVWAILTRYEQWFNTEVKEHSPKIEDVKRKPRPGVGIFIKAQLSYKQSPKQIVKMVQERFPESKANVKTIAWYKAKLKKENV